MKVTPHRLRHHLDRWRVNYRLVKGWSSARIDPYKGSSDFIGILLHHTASTGDSENYIVNGNPYAPVRACHFLVKRDGEVAVISGVGAYHAGKGGPWKITRRAYVPKDSGNSRLYGIEIESGGYSAKIDGKPQGMTVDQVVSTSFLCAALLDAMCWGPFVYRTGRVRRHRDWTNRKIDVQQDLYWWRKCIGYARRNKGNPRKAERLIRDYIAAHPDGRVD